jgi:hypothetical protein
MVRCDADMNKFPTLGFACGSGRYFVCFRVANRHRVYSVPSFLGRHVFASRRGRNAGTVVLDYNIMT